MVLVFPTTGSCHVLLKYISNVNIHIHLLKYIYLITMVLSSWHETEFAMIFPSLLTYETPSQTRKKK